MGTLCGYGADVRSLCCGFSLWLLHTLIHSLITLVNNLRLGIDLDERRSPRLQGSFQQGIRHHQVEEEDLDVDDTSKAHPIMVTWATCQCLDLVSQLFGFNFDSLAHLGT